MKSLAEILAQPDTVRTYSPPYPGGLWKATLILALGHIDAPVRPYAYIGVGYTEQAAIDHLNALEAADTWSGKSSK